MAQLEDTDFNPNAQAEREEAEREAIMARRIRREVLRVQSGDADEDIAEDKRIEEEQQEAEREDERREHRRRSSLLWLLISGNILIKEGFRENYRYLIIMAATFFVSIAVMFTTLHLDMKYNRLESELKRLRERSVRMQELRFGSTSHSSIVGELEKRGIYLTPPQQPVEIIE